MVSSRALISLPNCLEIRVPLLADDKAEAQERQLKAAVRGWKLDDGRGPQFCPLPCVCRKVTGCAHCWCSGEFSHIAPALFIYDVTLSQNANVYGFFQYPPWTSRLLSEGSKGRISPCASIFFRQLSALLSDECFNQIIVY